MAAFVKFEQFAQDVANKIHDLYGTNDTLKACLTNIAPNVGTAAVLADITQISAGNGYLAGGLDIQNDSVEVGGVVTVTAQDVTWTGGPSAMAPFRWIVIYNETPTIPLKPLIGYYDYTSVVTLQPGETFKLDFNALQWMLIV